LEICETLVVGLASPLVCSGCARLVTTAAYAGTPSTGRSGRLSSAVASPVVHREAFPSTDGGTAAGHLATGTVEASKLENSLLFSFPFAKAGRHIPKPRPVQLFGSQ
jgi:hypothetical protein